MDLSYRYWYLAMVLLEFLVGEVRPLFFDVAPCSVNTWYILEHISLRLLWVLATNMFSWLDLASYVVLDVRCPLGCDVLVEFSPWYLCCWGHIFFLPYMPLHPPLMLIHLSFAMLATLPSLWFCSSWSFWLYPCLLPFSCYQTSGFCPLFFLTIFRLLIVAHLCYPLLCRFDLSLTEYLLLYLSFLEYVIG